MAVASVPDTTMVVTAKGKVVQPTATGTMSSEVSANFILTLPATVASTPTPRPAATAVPGVIATAPVNAAPEASTTGKGLLAETCWPSAVLRLTSGQSLPLALL